MTPLALTLICALVIALVVAAALAAAWRSEAIETRGDVRKLKEELDKRNSISPGAASQAPNPKPANEDRRWVFGIHAGMVYVSARGTFESWVPVESARLYAASLTAMADTLDPPDEVDPATADGEAKKDEAAT